MSDGFLVLRGEGGGYFSGFGPDGPMVAGPSCGVARRFADSEELGRYLAELLYERASLLTERFQAVEIAWPSGGESCRTRPRFVAVVHVVPDLQTFTVLDWEYRMADATLAGYPEDWDVDFVRKLWPNP